LEKNQYGDHWDNTFNDVKNIMKQIGNSQLQSSPGDSDEIKIIMPG
jgi:virulence-associated protein VapD